MVFCAGFGRTLRQHRPKGKSEIRNPKSEMVRGPADMLYHAAGEIASGSKLGLGATKQHSGENFNRPWPPLIKTDEAVKP